MALELTKIDAGYTTEQPTMHLRFVVRTGTRHLQQRWAVTTYSENAVALGVHGEWRDVQVRLENDPADSE